jgi:hypothetical protein
MGMLHFFFPHCAACARVQAIDLLRDLFTGAIPGLPVEDDDLRAHILGRLHRLCRVPDRGEVPQAAKEALAQALAHVDQVAGCWGRAGARPTVAGESCPSPMPTTNRRCGYGLAKGCVRSRNSTPGGSSGCMCLGVVGCMLSTHQHRPHSRLLRASGGENRHPRARRLECHSAPAHFLRQARRGHWSLTRPQHQRQWQCIPSEQCHGLGVYPWACHAS